MMPRRILPIFLLLLAAGTRAAGQAGAQAPFAAEAEAAPGERLQNLEWARLELQLGLPSLAAGRFEQLLADASPPPGTTRDELALDLARARLDDGDPPRAELALQQVATGAQGAAWHLLAGLVAAGQRRWDAARAELALAPLEGLAGGDRAWRSFLQGRIADAAHDYARSLAAYEQAAKDAVSDAQRTRFTVHRGRARTQSGEATEQLAAQQRRDAEANPGTLVGQNAAADHAATLTALGRRDEAVKYLQGQLRSLPASPAAATAPSTRKARDDFRFLIGLIAGAADGEGRIALGELIADADNREEQRAALQLLAGASPSGPAREELRVMLEKRIDASPEHPLLADLLLTRARLALEEKSFDAAEVDARRLLDKFPRSPLRTAAYGTLVGVAWEQARYRAAADSADKAREGLPAGAERATLGALRAEAWFHAGENGEDANDYKNAAAAYAAALEEPPPNVPTGRLVFWQALALMRAGLAREAGELLDRLAGDTRLDPLNRWRAEWNLANKLKTLEPDGVRQAYARVNRLLADAPVPGLAPPAGLAELRVQMRWLQARLALDAGEAPRARELARALRESLAAAAEIAADLRAEVAAGAQLLEAQAELWLAAEPATKEAKQEHETAALETLRQLRKDYPESNAAMDSFLEEAEHQARPGTGQKIVEAETLLQQLADKFPDRLPYAPLALFRWADLEAQRGQPENLKQALDILDRLLGNQKYAGSDLVFPAWMEQGRLLSELGQFPKAELIYDLLRRDFATHLGVREAELALADTHAAQRLAPDGDKHFDAALSGYLRLQGLAGVSPDLRVEAGCKLGVLLAEHGDKVRAVETWQALADPYLAAGRPGATPPPALGAKGRHWLDKALNYYAAQLAAEGRQEQSLNVLALIARLNLPSAPPQK